MFVYSFNMCIRSVLFKKLNYNPERDVRLCMLYSEDATDIPPVWPERPQKWECEQQTDSASPCTRYVHAPLDHYTRCCPLHCWPLEEQAKQLK